MTGGRLPGGETAQTSLTSVSHNSLVAHLGITDGCELVFGLFGQPLHPSAGAPSGKGVSKKSHHLDLSELFSGDGSDSTADQFFETLLDVLEALPSKRIGNKGNLSSSTFDAPRLVWDLLLSMPTNRGSIDRVQLVAQTETSSIEMETNVNKPFDEGIMVVDEVRCEGEWISLLDCTCFH